ncbi:MAG: SDR family oxidoreductase, partial [Acidobacteriota bacterium]|nr:SDR family oxidoreductase [Acidobacteriota bacterium]
AWERYRLPLAVTEAHLGCTREEQLRWFVEVWDAARGLGAEGAEVRAVTAWALLGSFDWDSLLTRAGEHYEPGVFDLRAPAPRPTALARLLRELARGEEPTHAVLDSPGWWQRLERLLYLPEQKKHATAKTMAAGASGRLGSVGTRARSEVACAQPLDGNVRVGLRGGKARTLLLTGATGTLGRAFARACRARAIPYQLLTRAGMDIADPSSVESALEEFEPWAVVNAAGYVRVDEAEREPELCRRENADGPAVLADACAARGVALVTFSSDLVFNGSAQRPYVERDVSSPLNAYGRSKAEGEARVLAAHPSALVVRTSAFFGPEDEYNFVTVALRALAEGRRFAAARDLVVSPTYVPDLAGVCLDLLIDGERGLWHLSNQGALTWAELARRAAVLAGLDAELVEARPSSSLGLVAARPRFSALASERGLLLPPLESALRRYVCERAAPSFAHSPRARA